MKVHKDERQPKGLTCQMKNVFCFFHWNETVVHYILASGSQCSSHPFRVSSCIARARSQGAMLVGFLAYKVLNLFRAPPMRYTLNFLFRSVNSDLTRGREFSVHLYCL